VKDIDWLDNDAVEQARSEQEALRVEFAQNHYSIFESDPRARALLAQWDAGLYRKRTPVDATLQRYAADEAVRAFIAGIHEQIRIAREGKI